MSLVGATLWLGASASVAMAASKYLAISSAGAAETKRPHMGAESASNVALSCIHPPKPAVDNRSQATPQEDPHVRNTRRRPAVRGRPVVVGRIRVAGGIR